MDTLGDRLKFLRGGQSQAAFAALLGIPQVTLGNYERNRNEPRFELIRTICLHFGINVEWLLFGTGPMRPEEAETGKEDEMETGARLRALVRERRLADEERRLLDAERRSLSEENRRLYREKAELLERNADLRERVARLEGELRQPGTVRPAAESGAVA